jgi:hypothetical protein
MVKVLQFYTFFIKSLYESYFSTNQSLKGFLNFLIAITIYSMIFHIFYIIINIFLPVFMTFIVILEL